MAKVTRQRAKRGEGQKLRHEILEVADRLLLETGSENAVSIQMIADGVGCTPPAIYLHFADKDALMHEVCARHFESFASALQSAGSDTDDPLELLAERGRAYIDYGLHHPEVYRILFMQPAGKAARDASAAVADSFALVAPAVQECIERGVFLDRDPFAIACALWASIHGLTSLMISNPDFPWPPLEELFDIGLLTAAPAVDRDAG
jgi:AcrR family transcriptional regulator